MGKVYWIVLALIVAFDLLFPDLMGGWIRKHSVELADVFLFVLIFYGSVKSFNDDQNLRTEINELRARVWKLEHRGEN